MIFLSNNDCAKNCYHRTMIIIKTDEEIQKLREGGKRLATIVQTVAQAVRPGISTEVLNELAESLIKADGDIPAFKGYKPSLHIRPYPKTLITSINHEVVHGIPSSTVTLKEGDIISLDLGINHKECFTDHAITVAVGVITEKDKKLLSATREALYKGIDMAKVGNRVGDIGFAIETVAKKYGYGIVRELAGHGVGRYIHEDPFIPNYGQKGKGELLTAGMVIAIEPMFTRGTDDIYVKDDGYTVVTRDGSNSAHFEHTVLITNSGPEVLTETR